MQIKGAFDVLGGGCMPKLRSINPQPSTLDLIQAQELAGKPLADIAPVALDRVVSI